MVSFGFANTILLAVVVVLICNGLFGFVQRQKVNLL